MAKHKEDIEQFIEPVPQEAFVEEAPVPAPVIPFGHEEAAFRMDTDTATLWLNSAGYRSRDSLMSAVFLPELLDGEHTSFLFRLLCLGMAKDGVLFAPDGLSFDEDLASGFKILGSMDGYTVAQKE